MTQYGTWLSYGGDARIWLAIGLLAVAGGAALAGIPSAPLPAALNIASKILAFATALTLFLPEPPAQEQTPQPDSNEQARPASPKPALNSAASAEITGDPQLTGQPARSSVPGIARPRRRVLAGGPCGVLVLALVIAGCSSAGRPAGAPGHDAGPGCGPAVVVPARPDARPVRR